PPAPPRHPPPFPTRRASDLGAARASRSSSTCGRLSHHLTNAELVDGFHQLALLIDDFDCFFPLHIPSQLILQAGNHLLGRSIDKDRKSTRLNSSHQIISYAV